MSKTTQDAPEGACAPRQSVTRCYTALDWYDGPLRSIARVDFPAGDKSPPTSLIEVGGDLGNVEYYDAIAIPTPEGRTGEWIAIEKYARRDVSIRLTREDLLAALEMIDGLPVQAHDGKVTHQVHEDNTVERAAWLARTIALPHVPIERCSRAACRVAILHGGAMRHRDTRELYCWDCAHSIQRATTDDSIMVRIEEP